MFFDFREQLTGAVRLGDIVVAASRAGFVIVPAQRIGGHDDDRNRSQFGICLDASRRFMAVHNRQLDIHENQIRPVGLGGGDALLAILGLQ